MKQNAYSVRTENDFGNRLRVDVAETPAQRRSSFRLRHDVFTALGAHVGSSLPGLDQDEFDDVCQHITVWDGDRLAATSRVLFPEGARRIGCYFSSTEFDISALVRKHDNIVELGRVCVHPDYRSSYAVTMMFRFVALLAIQSNAEFLMGCGTLFERSPERVWAIAKLLRERGLVDDLGVKPVHAVPQPEGALAENVGWNDVARLIRAYLLFGGRIAGDPCIDPIFDSAEVLILMPVDRLARHFGKAAIPFQPSSPTQSISHAEAATHAD